MSIERTRRPRFVIDFTSLYIGWLSALTGAASEMSVFIHLKKTIGNKNGRTMNGGIKFVPNSRARTETPLLG